MAITQAEKVEFRSFGERGPTYQVLEIKPDSIKVQVVLTGEIIEDYPTADYLTDPVN